MTLQRNSVESGKFNGNAYLPFELRLKDFEMAMQDVYDFFYDVNSSLSGKGLQRLDDMLRPAIMSGILPDMLTASLANHSRVLTENTYFNGHPDLVVRGVYPDNAVKAGDQGIEIKATRKSGGGRGYARRPQPAHVRLRVQCRQYDGTRGEQIADDIRRNLPRAGNGR